MYETTMTMVGRLVDRPTRWDGASGPKATFRLARTERRFDKTSGAWVDGQTLYLGVTCWRVVAERVLASLGRGDPVIVCGRLQTREWEKDGKRHSVTELDATAVGPDLARCSVSVDRRPAWAAPAGAGDAADVAAVDGAVREVRVGTDAEPRNGGDAGGEPWVGGRGETEAPGVR